MNGQYLRTNFMSLVLVGVGCVAKSNVVLRKNIERRGRWRTYLLRFVYMIVAIDLMSASTQAAGIIPSVWTSTIDNQIVITKTQQEGCSFIWAYDTAHGYFGDNQYLKHLPPPYVGTLLATGSPGTSVNTVLPSTDPLFSAWECRVNDQWTSPWDGTVSFGSDLINFMYPVCPPSFLVGTAWGAAYCPATPAFYVQGSRKKQAAENGSSCSDTKAETPMQSCGDPINPASGNTYKTEHDLSVSGNRSIAFTRYYNSSDSKQVALGAGWRGTYSRSITINAKIASYQPLDSNTVNSSLFSDEASACTSGFAQIQSSMPTWGGAVASFSNGVCNLTKSGVSIGALPIYTAYDYNIAPEASPPSFDYISDDGQVIRFSVINGVITAPPGYGLKLVQTISGFTLTDGNDNAEQYDMGGRLLSVTSRVGVMQTMSYDSSGRLSSVVDSFGHQLTLSYDEQGHLITVTR